MTLFAIFAAVALAGALVGMLIGHHCGYSLARTELVVESEREWARQGCPGGEGVQWVVRFRSESEESHEVTA